MKKIFIYHHACTLRSLDARKVHSYFSDNNYKIVNNPQDAEIIFFIGCAAADNITNKSLQIVKEFKKYNAELIVAGCLPIIEKEKLNNIFDGRTIATKDLDKNPDKLDEIFPENKIKFRDIDDANILYKNLNNAKPTVVIKKIFHNMPWMEKFIIKNQNYISKIIFGENSFYYNHMLNDEPMYRIRISWGCNNNCSYCGIKKAIGSHNSKPLEQAIEEFKNGLNKGYKHFMLNADDIGAYGTDIKSSFSELLDKLTNIDGEYTISIADLSPRWLIKYVDDLEENLQKKKIIRLSIPLQSGNERILKLMNRYHNTEKIDIALNRIKKSFSDIVIDTHIISGFPTETEEEFKQTLCFVKECEFNAGYIFRFSCKHDTEAENIWPKVPTNEILERVKYAKKFLKKSGYKVLYTSKKQPLLFYK